MQQILLFEMEDYVSSFYVCLLRLSVVNKYSMKMDNRIEVVVLKSIFTINQNKL